MVSHVFVTWPKQAGATGYEIKINGQVVATTGPGARSSKVAVGPVHTRIEVTDLPARRVTYETDFLQARA